MFAYSMREKTHAHRALNDDVPEEVKQNRLRRLIDISMKNQLERSRMDIGRYHLVLVDGVGKKEGQLKGKSDTYRTVVFECPDKISKIRNVSEYQEVTRGERERSREEEVKKGDYVIVKIDRSTSNTLFGKPICKTDFKTFFELSKGKAYYTDTD